jgi:predicted pyridoxine 5'-phosphate oxidase superfamily flavin-nucleotide-binding protein
MTLFTDDVRRIVKETRLCFAATVNADGTPNLSPKSSLMVYDADHLAFANIASPGTVRNLRRNPAIEINAIDIFARRGYRFKGTAEIKAEGTPEYDFVATAFWGDNGKLFPIHEVVKVLVSRVAPIVSPAYAFIDGCDENVLRPAYHKKYGVAPLT